MIFLSKGSVLGGEHGGRLNWHTWQKHFFTIYYFHVFLSSMVWWCNMWKRRFKENIIRICNTECISPQLYTIMVFFLYLPCLFFASRLMTWTFGVWKCAMSCSSLHYTKPTAFCLLPSSSPDYLLLSGTYRPIASSSEHALFPGLHMCTSVDLRTLWCLSDVTPLLSGANNATLALYRV